MPNKFRAFVSGFGGGKTWCGSMAQCSHYLEHPGINQGYFAPTYPQIRDIFYPTIEEVTHTFGMRVEIREANKEVHFYRGRDYKGTTICRSMEKPHSIVGFKIGRALVDEFDLLEVTKALTAWKKIIARLRFDVPGVSNGADITTTPEGFRATYKLFVQDLLDKPEKRVNYGLVQSSTYENAIYLPDDYIPSLLEAYPDELIEAYIMGQFANLTSGTVYNQFSRTLNVCTDTVRLATDKQRGEPLHIGMDFNVNNMSAVVNVYRDGEPRGVAEIVGVRDTPAIIEMIKEQYPRHDIIIYPDASGGSANSTNASISDLSLLRDAGFKVDAPKANPRVRERVVSANAMFCNALGERRYKINPATCPTTVRDLEQLAYDANGEPDKKSGSDHRPDALSYYLHRRHAARGKPKVIIR